VYIYADARLIALLRGTSRHYNDNMDYMIY